MQKSRIISDAASSKMVGEEPKILISGEPPVGRGLNAKKLRISAELFLKVVGEEGFEPPTLWSQTRCATKLRYSPKFCIRF